MPSQEFELEKVLGSGGFGIVASVSSKTKPVFRAAIKVEYHMNAYEKVINFVQPFLLAIMVDSPYVARLYGSFTSRVFYKDSFAMTALLMELCGPSLKSEMESSWKRLETISSTFVFKSARYATLIGVYTRRGH
jgi:hypothetical protein